MLVGLTNTGVTFLVNAATFAAILVALFRIDARNLRSRVPASREPGQVMQGLRYSLRNRDLRALMLATLVISTFSQNFRVILPLFAAFVFAGGADQYGVLMSALGVGAFVAALITANLDRPTRRQVGWHSVAFGVAMCAASVVSGYWALVLLMVAVGFGNTSFNTTSQTMVLLVADADKRGRVLALRQLFSNGLTPVGSLMIGWVAAVTSPRVGLAVGGVAALVAALFNLQIRPQPLRPGLVVGERGDQSQSDTPAPGAGASSPA